MCIRDRYGFDLAIGEAYPPRNSLDRILAAFPNNRNVLFKGDSSTDEQTLDSLYRYHSEGRIISLTSVHTAGPFSKDRALFDISISRDYRPLVTIMNCPALREQASYPLSLK